MCQIPGYDSHPSDCGFYDDSDFIATQMCCGCGGGQSGFCENTNGAALDSFDHSCEWYENFRSSCGYYDDDDFSATQMCCACGGGQFMCSFESHDELAHEISSYVATTTSDDCGPIEKWDVSRVANFDFLFCGSSSSSFAQICDSNLKYANFDLSRWNVASVTSMRYIVFSLLLQAYLITHIHTHTEEHSMMLTR